jgi:hypothetical protein
LSAAHCAVAGLAAAAVAVAFLGLPLWLLDRLLRTDGVRALGVGLRRERRLQQQLECLFEAGAGSALFGHVALLRGPVGLGLRCRRSGRVARRGDATSPRRRAAMVAAMDRRCAPRRRRSLSALGVASRSGSARNGHATACVLRLPTPLRICGRAHAPGRRYRRAGEPRAP